MLIIVYLIEITSDVKSKKEHTPAPLKLTIIHKYLFLEFLEKKE